MSDSPQPSPPSVERSTTLPDWAGRLIEGARAADGQPPFSDQSLVEARRGERTVLTVGTDALALVAANAEAAEPAEAELVVAPSARRRGIGTALASAVTAEAGGPLVVWAHGDSPASRILAERFGAVAERTLYQLRCPVPGIGHADMIMTRAIIPSGLMMDRFWPGTDDARWLALNAEAFAGHPEQGRLNQADLDDLMTQPWFDAADFLVVREIYTSELVAFCWLKVEDGIGEFYVVGVADAWQGKGLGRLLVTAGMLRLAQRDILTASLYVDDSNEAALRLYRSMGFTDHTVDVQYRL